MPSMTQQQPVAPTPALAAPVDEIAAGIAAIRQIIDWLRVFIEPGQLVELRAPKITRKYGKPVAVSGFFDSDHLREMAREAIKLTTRGLDGTPAPGVYFVFNPIRTDLLARCANRVDVSESGKLTTDTDILSRRCMLIDCDPVRLADISSTDEEKAAGRKLATECREYLTQLGWPEPIEADSGNGTHLYYRVNLPADDSGLIKAVLNSLADRFDNSTAKIDRTVFNASRITKCPGTWARKGDAIPGRPHRMAMLTAIPSAPSIVTQEKLESVAAEWKAKEAAKLVAAKPATPTSRPGRRGGNPRCSLADRVAPYMAKVPPSISGQGGHSAAFNAACVLVKGFALSIGDAYPILADWNARCDPPWSEGELRHKLDDAAASDGEPGYLLRDNRPSKPSSRPSAGTPSSQDETAFDTAAMDAEDSLLIPENQTDVALSRRFARIYGENLKYVPEWKSWIVWTGLQWRVDNTCQEVEFAKNFSEFIWREADKAEPDEAGPSEKQEENPLRGLAKRASTKKFIFDLLALSKSEKDFILPAESLDVSLTLFNVLNGTIDLRTGELQPHRRDDFITKICPQVYRPEATCPRWEQFLYQVMRHDTDLCQFLQAWFGYCMTGETREQSLAVLYGEGGNGKSVLVNTLNAILGGDYGSQAPATLLVERHRDEHPTILASLFGKRLVLCSETGEGARFNEALIKTLTGQDRISARKMYQDFWEFPPTHKFVLLTNHKPEVRGTDAGIWRRIILIPFLQYFWDEADGESGPEELRKDKGIQEKLNGEFQGILNWLVAGAKHWYANGWSVPAAARAATDEYRKTEDVIQRFIDDECDEGVGCRVKASALYKAYKRWCEDNGEYLKKQKKFGDLISARKYEKEKCDIMWYIGIGLKDELRGK